MRSLRPVFWRGHSRAVEAGRCVTQARRRHRHVPMELQHRLPSLGISHAGEVLAGEARPNVVLEHVREDRAGARESTRNRLILVVGPLASTSNGHPGLERRLGVGKPRLRRRSHLCARCAIWSVHERRALEPSRGVHLDYGWAAQSLYRCKTGQVKCKCLQSEADRKAGNLRDPLWFWFY